MNEQEEKVNGVEIKIRRRHRSSFSKKVTAVTPILAILTFLILGFCFDKWHPGWLVFFLVPIVAIIAE